MNDFIKGRLAVFGKKALSTPQTVLNSFLLAQVCCHKNTEGDFVECGVFCGTQIAAMALANQQNGMKKKLYLFDSFKGIPEAGPNDGADIRACIGDGEGRLISTGISVSSKKAVRNHLAKWGLDLDQFIFYEGWFQNTVRDVIKNKQIEKIALLRLDGDLYESTKVCLKYLHPLVSQGGYVIIDDYNLTGCRKAVDEYWLSINKTFKICTIEGGGGPVYYQV